MLKWNDAVTQLKGVGPTRAKLFGQLGIETVADLMMHFPFRYEDIQARDLESILDQEKVTLRGKVVTPPVLNYFGGKKNRVSFKLAVNDHDVVQIVFFNQPYLSKHIQLGEERAIYGKWQANRQTLMGMKLIQVAQSDNEFSPVYRTTKGLKQSSIIQSMTAAFEQYRLMIPELVPQYLNDKYQLLAAQDALYYMHFPENDVQHHQAKRKVIFQEFFLYQWRLQQNLHYNDHTEGVQVHYDNEQLKDWIQTLPYELTTAQKKVTNDICRDLRRGSPMKRIVQGDVGSGKTLVAFLAMLATYSGGYQSALMVPTEILAKQHTENFNRLFEASGLKAYCLMSGISAKEKREVLTRIADGSIQFIIGTHALIQETVIFQQLGLVIIDEQHRFGVGQRQALIEKNSEHAVNVLQMTATPIPRTLAMTLYGELHVSTIDELPKGRQPIQTKWVKESEIEAVYEHIGQELQAGHQIYVVLPLIENSEHMEQIDNVLETAERLQSMYSESVVGVLHGQQDKATQTDVMTAYKANDIQLLVATTMVEVGVDVPNATIMMILSAERFGLAQLHQLRGRVGRGQFASYCYLVGHPTTDHGKERMKIMVSTQDGFVLSQEDLKIRGMGDLLGRHQSGIPQFHYANLIEDAHILQVAQQEVAMCLQQPHLLTQEESDRLTKWVTQRQIEL